MDPVSINQASNMRLQKDYIMHIISVSLEMCEEYAYLGNDAVNIHFKSNLIKLNEQVIR